VGSGSADNVTYEYGSLRCPQVLIPTTDLVPPGLPLPRVARDAAKWSPAPLLTRRSRSAQLFPEYSHKSGSESRTAGPQ
jgi:hypothetical protein